MAEDNIDTGQKKQEQKNPIVAIGNIINKLAISINEIKATLNIIIVDIKTNKANAEIFDKRFGLSERQLDNIEKELSRLKERVNKEKGL